jgi:hypothetical protein
MSAKVGIDCEARADDAYSINWERRGLVERGHARKFVLEFRRLRM